MSTLLLFNKPFNVICQFRSVERIATLADFIDVPDVYPAGRLDKDTEGLVVLTDDGRLQAQISQPRHKLPKRYWVQVEGDITANAIACLENGVDLNDGRTRHARASRIDEPDLPRRDPPIRYRKTIPTSWIELTITEGRNRQVRRMTAAVGYPTLRLYRYSVGDWTTDGIEPGEYRLLRT